MLGNGVGRKKHLKRFISFILICCLTLSCMAVSRYDRGLGHVYAAQKLKLSAAKKLAVANSEKIDALDSKIESKQAARQSAVKALEEKQRDMSTFRWSPLLKFKFPTTPNEAEAFEFQFKPVQLEYNIKTIKHQLDDEKLAEYEKVSNLYIDIITYTAEIAFLEERIENLDTAIGKNKAKVLEGTATKGQVELQEKKLKKMRSDIATQKKKLLSAKEKLGREIGFSITSGYTFDEEFVVTNMNRDCLEKLQQIAIENDQVVFEARQEMQLAGLNLQINYDLMRKKYGGDINIIQGYISQLQDGSGQAINKRAFKKDYDAFLKKIDSFWAGYWKILFFKISMEWLKGSQDGIRYIEDDPYVLYSAALDYQAACKDYNNACTELKQNVADSYDSLMDARSAYLSAKDDMVKEKADLMEAESKNAMGTMSLEEFEMISEEYEAARTQLKDSLSTYSKSLYSFDRITCGGASEYIMAESLSALAGGAGLGTAEKKTTNPVDNLNAVFASGATYSMRSIVDTQEFVLYVDIPDGFTPNVTHFELWADNRQIGQRVPVTGSIRHLKIAVSDVNSIFVRLYNGAEFVDDCAIDPDTSYGPLNITASYNVDELVNYPIIGTYAVEDDATTDMIRVRFTFDQAAIKDVYPNGADVAFYNLAAEKSLYLFSNDLIPVDQAFSYMAFIKRDVGKLTLRLFDQNGNYIGGARLDAQKGNIFVDKSVTNEDMNKMAARQILTEVKGKSLNEELKRVSDLYKAANGNSEDSATTEYYKKRIEEINNELKTISANISDEEIEAALSTYKDEISNRVSEISNQDDTADSEKVAEEISAKNEIIRDAAIRFVKEKKNKERKEAVSKTISDYQNELMKAQRQYAATSDEEAKAEVEQNIKDIHAKIKLEKDKIHEIDSSEVTEDEINEAMLENGDEIYSSVVDKLNSAMLYGTPAGKWAIQYLQAHGLADTEKNVRVIVAAASRIEDYEKYLERKQTIEKQLEEAQKKLDKLGKNNSSADKACVQQLNNIIKAYNKNLKALEKKIEEIDPGKELKDKSNG